MQDPTDAEASRLFQRHILSTGYDPPATYAELLLFVQLSGAPVAYFLTAPDEFEGVQLGAWVYVTGSPRLTDRQRMRVLAHEWGHWLRNQEDRTQQRTVQFYRGGDACDRRLHEEQVARAFERMF